MRTDKRRQLHALARVLTGLVLTAGLTACLGNPEHPYLNTADLLEVCSVRMNVAAAGSGPEEFEPYANAALYAACYSYLAAVVDSAFAAGEEQPLPEVCLEDHSRPGNVPRLDDVNRLFLEYVHADPEHAEAVSRDAPFRTVMEALAKAYPCPSAQRGEQPHATLVSARTITGQGQRYCVVNELDGVNHPSKRESEKPLTPITAASFEGYLPLRPGKHSVSALCESWESESRQSNERAELMFAPEMGHRYAVEYAPGFDAGRACAVIRDQATTEAVVWTCFE